mmetsp:Transcript_46573/g.83302  ORF Transcript_46573/g.83302 Transcript_46573/m.83302 type:complete len:318 (+) Transcript_46573:761-1714(+)
MAQQGCRSVSPTQPRRRPPTNTSCSTCGRRGSTSTFSMPEPCSCTEGRHWTCDLLRGTLTSRTASTRRRPLLLLATSTSSRGRTPSAPGIRPSRWSTTTPPSWASGKSGPSWWCGWPTSGSRARSSDLRRPCRSVVGPGRSRPTSPSWRTSAQGSSRKGQGPPPAPRPRAAPPGGRRGSRQLSALWFWPRVRMRGCRAPNPYPRTSTAPRRPSWGPRASQRGSSCPRPPGLTLTRGPSLPTGQPFPTSSRPLTFSGQPTSSTPSGNDCGRPSRRSGPWSPHWGIHRSWRWPSPARSTRTIASLSTCPAQRNCSWSRP